MRGFNMPILNVKFKNEGKRFPVYTHYQGQYFPQPAFLSLDIRDGALEADYSGEFGNAVPLNVWHDLVLRFKINPASTAEQIEEIINNNKQAFQAILDGSEEVWDDNNWVGKFSDEATAIMNSIMYGDALYSEGGGMMSLDTCLESNPFPSEDQTIEEFAQEIIDSDGVEGFYFEKEYHLDSMLSDLRDEWAEMVYRGVELPSRIAQYLIDHNACNDVYLDDLKEMVG